MAWHVDCTIAYLRWSIGGLCSKLYIVVPEKMVERQDWTLPYRGLRPSLMWQRECSMWSPCPTHINDVLEQDTTSDLARPSIFAARIGTSTCSPRSVAVLSWVFREKSGMDGNVTTVKSAGAHQ